MKKLLNTLFVTTQGAYLSKDGETVSVSVENDVKLRVPIHTLDSIVCFGRVSASPPLMGLCGERGVLISFLTEYGKFEARVCGPVSGNVLLRREQYRRADNPETASDVARSCVIGKVANARTVLLRFSRDNASSDGLLDVQSAAKKLELVLEDLRRPHPLDTVRGYEGEAAVAYFSVFDHLITDQKDDFRFETRSRRPPLDNVNALLSFIYTLLVHDITSALESVGLDPAVGFLHRDRSGRPSLALDIMEEFRPWFADRLALSLINRRQIKGSGFISRENGAVRMDDETRKTLLVAYQTRKQEEIIHPFTGEKVAIGLLPYLQALLLARHLRGDLDAYPPYIWK